MLPRLAHRRPSLGLSLTSPSPSFSPHRHTAQHRKAAKTVLYTAGLAALGKLSVKLWQRWARREYPPVGRMVRLPSGPVHVIEGAASDTAKKPDTASKSDTVGTAANHAAPPVVLIHGSDGVALDWPTSPLWEQLAGLQRLAPDRLGHGYTPAGSSVSIAANTAQLLELLEALGIERAVLVGHSYGGSVALAAAAQAPSKVAALVLVSPLAFPQAEQTRMLARLLRVRPVFWVVTRLLLVPLGLATVELEGGRAFSPMPIPPAWRRMMSALSLRAVQLAALTEENCSLVPELSALSQTYSRVKVPTFVLAGQQDKLAPPQWHGVPLAKALAHAQLQLLDGGHQLHWTHTGEVARAVRAAVATEVETMGAAATGRDLPTNTHGAEQ